MSFIDDSLRIGNKIVGDYTDKTTSYESLGKSDNHYSRHEAMNANAGIMTGRSFSEYLIARGWTIKEAARLNMTRFIYADVEVIGRDIRNVGISLDIVRDAVYHAWKVQGAIDIEFNNPDKTLNSLIAWRVDSGKRTRYGEKSDGNMIIKNTAPKIYRRKRKAW